MDETSGKTSPTAPPPATVVGPQTPAYEPPAVAWEEPFESVAASATIGGLDPECDPQPGGG